MLLRSRGKNAIEFRWDDARIYLDANTLSLALQIGFTIGGVYAPARIVQLVCGILGIGAGYIQHGIWFDYNYFAGRVLNAGFQ